MESINDNDSINEENCKFCNPILKKDYDLNIICPKYNLIYKKQIEPKTKDLLNKIFKSELYYLPNEIVNIIYDLIEYKKTNIISKINIDSVLHFGNCQNCSSKLLKYHEENLCHKHYLPRCIFPEDF